ncbi:MAG: ABC transporter ATP-binding protein [Alsobacter sp.]
MSAVPTPLPDPEPLLEVRDLRIEFRGKLETVVAVPGVSFTVHPGESYGLVGESGCGKSTTAMALMGHLGPTGVVAGGGIRFKGEDLVRAGPARWRALRGREIAMVYQDPMSALNPVKTVGAQLAEVPMLHLGANRSEALDMAAAMLRDVRLPDAGDMLKRYPHQLSGGQQQRVVIAMALLGRPSLLLLDEPTTGLDVTVEAAVIDLIAELRRRYRTSLLFISHNLGLIAESCDRVGIMYSGELVEEAPTSILFSQPRHPYTRGLIGCIPDIASGKRSRSLVPIAGHIPAPSERPAGCLFGPRCDGFRAGSCDKGAIAPEQAAALHMVRCVRWPDDPQPRAARLGAAEAAEVGSPVLHVDGLGKSFPISAGRTLKANDDVSLEARRAEIVALVGESGCGKSTLARIVAGLEQATAGHVRMLDLDVARLPAARRPRAMLQAVQMVFQNPDSTLNPSHSVGYAIRRTLRKFGLGTGEAEVQTALDRLLEMVRLPAEIARRKPGQLSGGQKQRIAIARAFAADPTIIVADEPVSALDVSVQAAVVTLLLDIQRERHATMLFISHDLALVRHVAESVVVMYLGKVVERGTVEEIFGGATHPYTEALISAVRSVDPSRSKAPKIALSGEIPSPIDLPPGCRFAGRCHRKLGPVCDTREPPLRRVSDTHEILCHIPGEDLARGPERPVVEPCTPP